MRTFPRFVVRGALPSALATLVALAACGGEPAVQTEVVAEFRREENAQHVKRLVSDYCGHELELQKRSDLYALRAPAKIARELRPRLERLLDRLALDDKELPPEPASGRPELRREFERRLDQNRLEEALHVTLRMHGIEFLSARVTLSMKCVDGGREGLYQHVKADVLLETGSRDIDDCRRLAQESLDAGIKTKAGSATVTVELVDLRDYLPAPPTQPAQAAPPAPTEPPLPAEPSAPPPVADANVAPKATASAAEPVAAAEPVPMPNVEPAPVVAAAAVSPAPTPMPCPAAPAAETTCPSPSGERQAASPTVPDSEPTVTPAAEPAADATAAEAADVPTNAAEAADPAPTETPDAPPRRGALWALYFVAIASLCGNVAFVLHWWRARRRENERARLARLFAKVA